MMGVSRSVLYRLFRGAEKYLVSELACRRIYLLTVSQYSRSLSISDTSSPFSQEFTFFVSAIVDVPDMYKKRVSKIEPSGYNQLQYR